MNGWDGHGGSIYKGGAHKQDMGVLTEARATILVTGGKGRKTTTKKNNNKSARKNANKGKMAQPKVTPSGHCPPEVQRQKKHNKEWKKRTKPAESTRAKNGQHNQQNNNMLFSLKKAKKQRKKQSKNKAFRHYISNA